MQKQIIMLFAIVALGLSVLSCQAPSSEADVEAIHGVLNEYVAAVNNGDVDGWLGTFADDAVVFPPYHPQLTGKEAIRSWAVTSLFEPFNIQLSASNQEVQIVEDWAFAHGYYSFTMTPKAGGKVIEDTGKYLNIFKRQPDGSWKYAREIHNSDMPLRGEEISTKG